VTTRETGSLGDPARVPQEVNIFLGTWTSKLAEEVTNRPIQLMPWMFTFGVKAARS